MNEIKYRPIGIVHSPFKEARGVPIQPAAGKDVEAIVEVFTEYAEGLEDLDGFSHIILIYHLHLSKGFALKVKPYLENQLRGVFSTRAPSRPNSVGLSVVRLDRIEGSKLYVRDVDIVDGTPLLDIKPYVPEFEERGQVRIGWLERRVKKLHRAKDDGRFVR